MIIGIIGLMIGSFLNVCIYRIPQGESIVFPPSHCSGCMHPLVPGDLIPLISYVMLKGKCRYCGEKIAVQYPVVELLTAIFFLLVYHEYGFSGKGITAVIMVCLLMIASLVDLNHMIIPNKLNLAIAVVGAGKLLFVQDITVLDSFCGFFLGGGVLFLMGKLAGMILHKEAMGGGDVKLLAACGIFLGLGRTLAAMLFAFYSAAFIIIILLVLKKLKRNQYVPFGPFISAGVIAVILYFEPLYHFYY